ncbi:MAG: hypothetical protein ACW97O_13220 [Candidatus Thorarchaeota archaeon]
MTDEDAIKYLIFCLRSEDTSPFSHYGYDVYVPQVMRAYAQSEEGLQSHELENRIRELSPHFFTAAWELCRIGILRPGVRRLFEQATDTGSAGSGYCITSYGRTWLDEPEHDDFIPTEPGRFGELLEPFKKRLGPGFHERAQQAVRCYGAHAHLACCAMCGAAAESILLAIAIKKETEEEVLKKYSSAGGRGRIEKLVLGQARERLRTEFRGFLVLLKYWRDEASHGRASGISEIEALTSLTLLLRFGHYVNDHWNELIGK